MKAKFECDIEAIARSLQIDADNLMAKIAMDVHGELIDQTPVDTGRARAGWSARTGGPGDDMPPKKPTPKGWKPGNAPFYPVPTLANLKTADRLIVLYNNVEYVVFLNEGHSRQAPSMFVEKAVQKVLGSIPSF